MHSLRRPFIHSFIPPFIYSLIHLFIQRWHVRNLSAAHVLCAEPALLQGRNECLSLPLPCISRPRLGPVFRGKSLPTSSPGRPWTLPGRLISGSSKGLAVALTPPLPPSVGDDCCPPPPLPLPRPARSAASLERTHVVCWDSLPPGSSCVPERSQVPQCPECSPTHTKPSITIFFHWSTVDEVAQW